MDRLGLGGAGGGHHQQSSYRPAQQEGIPVSFGGHNLRFREVANPHMGQPENRRQTFQDSDQSTFLHTRVTVRELVNNGFFKVPGGDRVKCVVGNCGLENFAPNDVVADEHALYFPDCDLVKAKHHIRERSLPSGPNDRQGSRIAQGSHHAGHSGNASFYIGSNVNLNALPNVIPGSSVVHNNFGSQMEISSSRSSVRQPSSAPSWQGGSVQSSPRQLPDYDQLKCWEGGDLTKIKQILITMGYTESQVDGVITSWRGRIAPFNMEMLIAFMGEN